MLLEHAGYEIRLGRSKNDENIRKHFLDFEDARLVFDGPMLTAIDDRFEYDETRIVAIGFLRNLVVVLVYTEPADGVVRIISFRKALKNERQKFFRFFQDRLG